VGKSDIVFGHARPVDLFYWMRERHSIWKKRDAGLPKPWTDDPILQDYKFTNMFRELDRGTLALRRMCFGKEDPGLLAFNIIWYRLFNVDTHAKSIGFVDLFQELADKMLHLDACGEKIFTSAHMTVGRGGERKILTTLNSLREIWAEREIIADCCRQETRLEEIFYGLQAYYCIGPFIAYEIVCDFRWYEQLLGNATDTLTWANIGPGCKRGLYRMGLEQDIDSLLRLYDDAWNVHRFMPDHHVACCKWNEVAPAWPLFELREIEHSLCEFDKYQRVKTGVGKPRQLFNGRK
jgi:hypothetical protein